MRSGKLVSREASTESDETAFDQHGEQSPTLSMVRNTALRVRKLRVLGSQCPSIWAWGNCPRQQRISRMLLCVLFL